MSIYIYLFVLSLLCLFIGGYIYRLQAGVCKSTNRMDGKVVVITGATAGIGKYTALDLAKRGAKVILACRNMTKARNTSDWIKGQCNNKEVFCLELDVSDLNSVRSFAKELLATEAKVDVLINNAGAGFPNRRTSPQGFELTLATNHMGHFLLTHLILELLKKAPAARILNVSSLAHKYPSIDIDDLHFKTRKYSVLQAYGQSKLCNILFTNELSVRLNEFGITANSLHPGTVATELANKEKSLLGTFLENLTPIIGKTSESGAQTTIYLAVADEVAKVTGEYFSDCVIDSRSKDARDVVLARKVWTISEKEVQLPEELKI